MARGIMKQNSIRLGVLCSFVVAASGPASGSETTTYTYDALGRLVSSSTTGTVNNGLSVTAAFDAAGNRSSYNVSGATGSIITSATYSTSSTESPSSGLSGAGAAMRDGVYDTYGSIHITNIGASEWIRMDLGSIVSVGKVVLVPISPPYGGGGYVNGGLVERSSDGISWTSIATVSGAASGSRIEYSIGTSARYIRITKSSILGLGDFYAIAP
jgi:hypothetical protein